MIDLVLYRMRIGTFYGRSGKLKVWKFEPTYKFSVRLEQSSFKPIKSLLIICLIASLSLSPSPSSNQSEACKYVRCSTTSFHPPDLLAAPPLVLKNKKETNNFKARYMNGNSSVVRGIKNMHLNIRSLRNKVFEIKHLVNLEKLMDTLMRIS